MTYYRPMTGFAPAAPSFEPEDFIRLLWARRRLILRVSAATVAAAILIALLLPTVYSASAVVMLDPRKNSVTDPSAVLAGLEGDPASLQNQIQILSSRDLAAKVIARLKLDEDPEFNPALARPGLDRLLNDLAVLFDPRNWFADFDAGQRIQDRVLDEFAKHVGAGANGLSTAITVTATSREAAKAARIANEMVRTYIADQVAIKRTAAGGATDWLNQKIHELGEQLQQQQSAIAAYKAVHGLNDAAPGASLVDQQMTAINTQIVQARSDLAEKQAQSDRVAAMMRAGDGADIAQVVSSPLIVQLRTQQADLVRQLGELSPQYGPLHPKMKALQSEKTDLDRKIAQEVDRLAGAIGSDVAVARAHLASLEASLKKAVQQQTSQNLSRVQLDAMQANAASTRTQYEAFVSRLRQTEDQDAAVAADSRMISTAAAPTSPSSPKRKLIVLASVPLGLLLGVMAALLSERFSAFVPAPALPGIARPGRRTDPVFPQARIVPVSPAWSTPQVLADFPDIVSLRAADAILDQPASPFAYRMAALVRRLKPRDGAVVVTMTAAAAGENKSAIAVSLARAAARMGRKVVLLDCDPAQEAGRALKIADMGGIYDVLTGAIPLNRVLTRDPRSALFVLSMKRQPPNMSAMLGSAQMKKLLRLLRDNCDMVVVDCGEAGAPETWPMARLSDATLLVSRRNGLNTPALSRAVHLLGTAKAAAINLIVTR